MSRTPLISQTDKTNVDVSKFPVSIYQWSPRVLLTVFRDDSESERERDRDNQRHLSSLRLRRDRHVFCRLIGSSARQHSCDECLKNGNSIKRRFSFKFIEENLGLTIQSIRNSSFLLFSVD